MEALGLLALFVIGLCVGSFGNVVIWRVPVRSRVTPGEGDAPDGAPEPGVPAGGERAMGTVVKPASYCPQCHAPLLWFDNIPLVSWLALRGRCRHCDARIPVRYPLVEAATGVLWVLLGLRFGAAWELPAYLALGAGLVILSAVDLELYVLPNRIVYPTGFVFGGLLLGATVATGEWSSLRRGVIAAAVSFVAFFLMHLLFRGGMGFGDVRLSFVLGLALGWLGAVEAFFGFFFAFLLGSVVGVTLIALGRRGRKQALPFGPFMAAGAMIVILTGQWYLGAYHQL